MTDEERKAARRKYRAEWYQKNREKILAQQKEYRQANREKITERGRDRHQRYYQEHREELKLYQKRWRIENPEKEAEAQLRYWTKRLAELRAAKEGSA